MFPKNFTGLNRIGTRRFQRRLDPRKIPINFNAGPTTNPLSTLFKLKTDDTHKNMDWKKALPEYDPNLKFTRLDASCNMQGVRKKLIIRGRLGYEFFKNDYLTIFWMRKLFLGLHWCSILWGNF